MKIGAAWTKETKEKNTFISVELDEVIKELYPELKNLNFTLWHIPKEERRSENSPSWAFSISKKEDKKEEPQAEDLT